MPLNRARALIVSCCALALGAAPSAASPSVIQPAKSDVSAPLTMLVGATRSAAGNGNSPVARATGPSLTGAGADPVAQALSGTFSPSIGLSFAGQSADDNRSLLAGVAYVPPDTNGAVGARQYVQTVNVTFAVYDKASGALQLGPALLTDVWAGFGGLCETVEGGDPVVLYDQIAHRWIITQLAYDNTFTNNLQCIAVSQTEDATGRYNRYAYPFSPLFNDYPKFGVWPDAYYYSANMYAHKFVGAIACAFDRSAMLHGKPAGAVCFQNDSTVSSLLPSTLDGSTLPPDGAPNLFVGIADSGHLNAFQFHVDFATPANSTFAGTTVPVAPFNEICARATSLACIPEPSPGENVDGLGDRLMWRLAYRNFGDHESLVVNHTIAGGPLAAVRWYELRNPKAPFVYQQGTVFDAETNYWLGSIAMDKVGDIALGFSASSKSLNPSVYAAGQPAGSAPGRMFGPLPLQAGGGVQLNDSYRRWGDYSSMSVDPTDDCTFWYTQELYRVSGAINWATQISSFKFANCN